LAVGVQRLSSYCKRQYEICILQFSSRVLPTAAPKDRFKQLSQFSNLAKA
jgi:hypothetical protein